MYKTTFLRLAFFASMVLWLSGCCWSPNKIGMTPFETPNLITVLNPQPSYQLNDTLWVRIIIPASMSSKVGYCNMNNSSIWVYHSIFALYPNDSTSIDNFFTDLPIIPKIGQRNNLEYEFVLMNQYYVAEFGAVFNKPNVIGLGPQKYGSVMLESRHQTLCSYKNTCHKTLYEGFRIITSFQGGNEVFDVTIQP